ncbi:MAG: class I SAM-dependent methyltransferase [Eubacterium sp.]
MQKLSIRLSSVAALVKQDAAIADIGTDHGYIPVYLAEKKIIKSAVASDINEGPLNSCVSLVKEKGLENIIKTIISNGLDSLNENDFDTIIIAGMGGELIADILSRHSFVKKKHIILQPMTHPEVARKFLYDNGFEIENDIIVKDGRHYYSIFDAYYTGKITEKSRVDYYLGNITDFSNKEYFKHLLNYFKNKSKSGEDYSYIISALEKII